jgi:DNA-binding protein HU-beta
VNKAQLIDAVAERLGGSKKDANDAVEAVLDTITRNVVAGTKISITGFGSFEKVDRPARMARNPRTGERVRVKKSSVPKFRAGQAFKDVVSGDKKLPKMVRAAASSSSTASASSTTRKAAATKAAPAKAAAKRTTAKRAAATGTARKTTATKSAAKKATSTTRKTTAAKKTTTTAAKRSTAAAKRPAATKKATVKKTAAKRTAKR